MGKPSDGRVGRLSEGRQGSSAPSRDSLPFSENQFRLLIQHWMCCAGPMCGAVHFSAIRVIPNSVNVSG